jgi:pyruvate formate lyase activating enzyme
MSTPMALQSADGSAGWVFDIKKYSVHDGPGIRTTVFLKGCPLRCLWCSNPESQQVEPQIVFWCERCIHCDACLAVCSQSAIAVDEVGQKRVLPERCDLCGQCLEVCYAGALEQIGRLMTVDEVLSSVEKDRLFYEESGGGVTLSGGEPTAQPWFCLELLQGCKERGFHTVVDTCGHTPWKVWETLLPYIDMILYDLKEMDPNRHQRCVGVSNALILDNLRRLAHTGKSIIVRRPVIPGYNDEPAGVHALARFVAELGTIPEIDLLPYHRYGRGKYERLGMRYPMGDEPSMQDEEVFGLRDILVSYGFRVKVGG